MQIENMTNQEWRLDVSFPEVERKGVTYAEPPKLITITLDRKMAREAWEKMQERERAELRREPVTVRDLAAIAKEHGVDAKALLACIQRDALVRAAIADGRLVLTEIKAKG